MVEHESGTITWPEFGMALYDKLTGRHAEITYEFDNLEISVPLDPSAKSPHAQWIFNGILRIRSKDIKTK